MDLWWHQNLQEVKFQVLCSRPKSHSSRPFRKFLPWVFPHTWQLVGWLVLHAIGKLFAEVLKKKWNETCETWNLSSTAWPPVFTAGSVARETWDFEVGEVWSNDKLSNHHPSFFVFDWFFLNFFWSIPSSLVDRSSEIIWKKNMRFHDHSSTSKAIGSTLESTSWFQPNRSNGTWWLSASSRRPRGSFDGRSRASAPSLVMTWNLCV